MYLLIAFVFHNSLLEAASPKLMSVGHQIPSQVRVRLFKDLQVFPKFQNNLANVRIQKISPQLWSVQGKNLKFQNEVLPYQSFILQKENHKFDFIVYLDFDEYLAGVLSKEMPLRWPMEALKAQAIVARSFTIARMQERLNAFYQLDASQMDQMFSLTTSTKAIQAVLQTQDQVLTTPQGNILKAYYHADCGGQTVPASTVWAQAIDSGTASDPWCAERKSNQWQLSYSQKEFAKKIAAQLPRSLNEKTELIMTGQPKLELFKEKILNLSLAGRVFSAQKLREILGFSTLKSAPSRIEKKNGEWIFTGQGYGHGAGLCQWGSLELARRGHDYQKILAHYYPQAVFTQLKLRLTQNATTNSKTNSLLIGAN